MSNRTIEPIFNVKNNLEDFYPNYLGIKTFDLEKKHLFYGRIDRKGNAIYIDDSNLDQAYTGGGDITEFAADFVVDAFDDFRAIMINAHSVGSIDKNGAYNGYIAVKKAWSQGGDLENAYFQHINKLYREFIQEHLIENRKFEKIMNFKDFVREFVSFSSGIARYFPVTKTGYILSQHCSPFVSGLMLEVAEERHGVQNNQNVIKYATDKNFLFFVKEASKFGFMVDKNAPWRLVFNIASGKDVDPGSSFLGGRKYMDNYGVNFENIFDSYYVKSHLQEISNLKRYFLALYESFYTQYSTVETVKACQGYIKTERKDRQPPPMLSGLQEEGDEYWLKVALTLRLVEADHRHNNQELKAMASKMIQTGRQFGQRAALNYINDLTKGLYASKFIRKGMYWHGNYDSYEQRKEESLEIAENPDRVDYSLTGTKILE